MSRERVSEAQERIRRQFAVREHIEKYKADGMNLTEKP
jgi:hypothetical protein